MTPDERMLAWFALPPKARNSEALVALIKSAENSAYEQSALDVQEVAPNLAYAIRLNKHKDAI